jgi:hypothetical protein
MATIIEGARWTLTNSAAERMVEKGLITKCDNDHIDVIEADLPIYHRYLKAPDWFGFTTVHGAIITAEKEVANDSSTK